VRTDRLEQLYDEHAQALFGFLVYRTGNRALAEDVVADTFERALRSRRRFDPRRGSEKTWLYSIALNLLRDHARRAGAERRALERTAAGAPPDVVNVVDVVDEREAIAAALAKLPPDEREAVALRYGADLTVPEVARATRQKLTTTEGRLRRGLAKLREELG
jgi:RNA polymerase sigma factor (sigma-70 family)